MNRSKKILHIAGGVSLQKLYQHIFSQFSKQNIHQDVYVPCNHPSKFGQNEVAFPNLRYRYEVVGNMLDRILFFPKVNKHFAAIEEAFDTSDYSHCFAYTVMTDGSLAYRLKKSKGIPYSVFVRNTDINIFYKYFVWLRPFFKKILAEADYINFPNPSYKDRLLSIIGVKFAREIQGKVRVVPNGIDDFWHEHQLIAPKVKTQKPIQLIFVGKIDANKNVDRVVKAVQILNKKAEYKLVLVGAVSEDKVDELEKWKRELSNKISYVGDVSDKELLLAHYRKADIFVMPSKTETFGLVYIEALTQRLPIIFTDGEGVAGFFKEKQVGLAVSNPNDEHEISAKIAEIASNYSVFTQNTINESAQFSWGKIIHLYIKQIDRHEKV